MRAKRSASVTVVWTSASICSNVSTATAWFWSRYERQRAIAERSRADYAARLAAAGYPQITTEIVVGGEYHLAEDYHQQYLEKNPDGYCGLRGTGVACAVSGTSPA